MLEDTRSLLPAYTVPMIQWITLCASFYVTHNKCSLQTYFYIDSRTVEQARRLGGCRGVRYAPPH